MIVKKIIKKFVPGFLLNFYHYLLALAGAVIFGFPGKRITVIGVTGTSGKSTTVNFITKILEESGAKVASVSSIRFKIGGKEWKNELKMTMPGRLAMPKFLRQAVKEKCKFAVLEITSEGIRQHRHRFINFDTVVFTNLSPEHIESHGGFENYRNEKLKLFRVARNVHIINSDDENAKYFLEIPAKKTLIFGIKNKNKHSNIPTNVGMLLVEDINDGNGFFVRGIQFKLNLLGMFNIYNSLAAIVVAIHYGISLDICKKALEKVSGIPGRMEIIQKEPFLVVVDYAHTPVQLEKVYQTLNPKPYVLNPKLICVLGSCGGGRDKWKRPVLGEVAGRYCGEIILTNEDPYDENPFSIMDEIEKGFSQIQNQKYEKILDRKQAIEKAVKLAKAGDVVIITGKGSETWMCVENGKKIPWDDREIAREAMAKLTSINYSN